MKRDTPLALEKVLLPSRILYAPLAGCSDFPFRKQSAKYRPGLMFCEMVKMEALVRFDSKTLHLLDYAADMHPIGAQLCGSNPAIAGEAAKIVENLGFDTIDLNCGCPVDKITKDGSGSGLLRNPYRIGEILHEMKKAVSIPVTLKIRAGWDEKQICVGEIVAIAEEAGAAAVCVHGRTREQGYSGPADWNYIRMAKEAARKIKVIGNGDIVDGPSAARMFAETGCDALLIGRGTLGTPWIAEEVRSYLNGEAHASEDSEKCRQGLFDHFLEVCRYHPDQRIPIEMRRIGCWYLKKGAGMRRFREKISRATTLAEVEELLRFCSPEWEEDQPSSSIAAE